MAAAAGGAFRSLNADKFRAVTGILDWPFLLVWPFSVDRMRRLTGEGPACLAVVLWTQVGDEYRDDVSCGGVTNDESMCISFISSFFASYLRAPLLAVPAMCFTHPMQRLSNGSHGSWLPCGEVASLSLALQFDLLILFDFPPFAPLQVSFGWLLPTLLLAASLASVERWRPGFSEELPLFMAVASMAVWCIVRVVALRFSLPE